jgi:PhoPQ-activated pathogenicity-related protein
MLEFPRPPARFRGRFRARDFRIDALGPGWTSESLAARSDGSYTASVDAPEAGWTAFFVELTYPGAGKYPFKFTTDVRVVPDALPYALERLEVAGGS